MNQTISRNPCCAPSEKQTRAVEEEIALLAKALSHPARVRILQTLASGDTRVCREIAGVLPLAQSTVSEHLRILKEAGLIRSREDGTRVLYCVVPEALQRLKALVAGF